MLHIHCSGTPYQIGLTHGQQATVPISRTIAFYTWMFADSAKLSWPQVLALAKTFLPNLQSQWPAYLAEMQGIADGAGVTLEDIVAINVRTEITFGLFSDGCTALSWKMMTGEGQEEGEEASWLAQNWDWNPQQQENLVQLTIEREGKPRVQMMTEAGLIGKIGLNEAGVGVCLNAIKAKGMDPLKIPCHLGLRMVLDSMSREEAVEVLERVGVASACHMLVADASGGVGLEWSSVGVNKIEMNGKGQVFHSNHYLIQHRGVEDKNWLADSNFRVGRIEELAGRVDRPSFESLIEVFKDTENWPGSICRSAEGKSTSATLFNIIMDLKGRTAKVMMGRPVEPTETFELSFNRSQNGKF